MLILIPLAVQAGGRLRGKNTDPVPDPVPLELEPAPTPVVEPAPPPAPPAPRLFPSGPPVALTELPKGLANLSAQGCNACHYAAHDEWEQSGHRGAWVEQPFRRAVTATGDSPLCLSCHLPISNQQALRVLEYTGGPLSTAKVRDNEAWDPTLQQEGVTCAACHVREGTVLGTHASARAPHPVVVSEELKSGEICASCHQLTWPGADQPFYDTWGEYSRSAWSRAGVRCQDCHMPLTAGPHVAGQAAAQASHQFSADPARALSVLLRMKPGAAVRGQPFDAELVLQNTGAGHAIPTGSPFKSVKVEVIVLDAEGKPVGAPFAHTLKREVSPDPPFRTLSDQRLQAGQTLSLPVHIDLPQKAGGGAGAVEVRLIELSVDGAAKSPFAVQRIPITVY